MSAAPSSSPTQAERDHRRAREAVAQPSGAGRQAGDADRRLHRARDHLGARVVPAWCARPAPETEVHLQISLAADPSGSTTTASTCRTGRSCWPAITSPEEMAKILGVDCMGYLSRTKASTGRWTRECGIRVSPQFTDHHFTGEYPTRLLDREIAEGRPGLHPAGGLHRLFQRIVVVGGGSGRRSARLILFRLLDPLLGPAGRRPGGHFLHRPGPALRHPRRDRHRLLRLQEEPGERRTDGRRAVSRPAAGAWRLCPWRVPPDPADGLRRDRPTLRKPA